MVEIARTARLRQAYFEGRHNQYIVSGSLFPGQEGWKESDHLWTQARRHYSAVRNAAFDLVLGIDSPSAKSMLAIRKAEDTIGAFRVADTNWVV